MYALHACAAQDCGSDLQLPALHGVSGTERCKEGSRQAECPDRNRQLHATRDPLICVFWFVFAQARSGVRRRSAEGAPWHSFAVTALQPVIHSRWCLLGCCCAGTERCEEAVSKLKRQYDIVVNIQVRSDSQDQHSAATS